MQRWESRDTAPPAGATLASVAPLTTEQVLALLAPIVVIQLGLMIVALHDLESDERHVRGGSKLVWVLVIVFVNVVGPIIYLIGGREDA
ncbi:MAG: hypothetical protein QOE42_1440 [Chloroflexota bacterium]|nr:hypothetical protein [Chloroflexota bacterium]